MKKIGILTFHRSINYGAYMQCLSLSHYLSENLPDCKVEVIDYESKIMHDIYVPKINLSAIRHPKLYFSSKVKYSEFQKAAEYLPLSSKHFISDGDDEALYTYIKDNYDIVIVGSDAVWNWVKRGFPNPYLLKKPDGVLKFSYAASAYGMGPEFVGEDEQQYLKDSFENFKFIGVRDEYTRELVLKACPEAKVFFTCDPTVFLDLNYVLNLLGKTKESFREYIYKKYSLPPNKIIIGVMGTSNETVSAIKKQYGDKCYIVCLYSYLKEADNFMSELSPLEWALVFGLFDLTITSYFHGTLLSLRNNTPVISIDKTDFSKHNEGKIHDVLRRTELLDCYFTGDNTVDDIVKQSQVILNNKQIYKNKISDRIQAMSDSKEKILCALKEVL